MPPPSSHVTATQIPNITELRKQLDYGDATLSRCANFYDDLRVYRKKYHTKDGKPGTEMHEWKTPEAQAELDEITAAYLDKDGNGQTYWPDDGSAANYNSLQYSKHRSM